MAEIQGPYGSNSFSTNFNMALENGQRTRKAWVDMDLAEKGQELVEKKLEAVKLDDIRATDERTALIKLA